MLVLWHPPSVTCQSWPPDIYRVPALVPPDLVQALGQSLWDKCVVQIIENCLEERLQRLHSAQSKLIKVNTVAFSLVWLLVPFCVAGCVGIYLQVRCAIPLSRKIGNCLPFMTSDHILAHVQLLPLYV